MQHHPVASHMRPCSEWAKSSEPAATVAERMRSRSMTHMPVVEDGTLKGVLSEHDLAIFEAVSDVSLAQLTVADLMCESFCPTTPSSPLSDVLLCMAEHGHDCAVVMDQSTIRGLLSHREAVRAATDFVLDASDARDEPDPETARELVLCEHAHVQTLLSQAEDAARRLQRGSGSPREISSVHARASQVLEGMRSLLALEDSVLAPALAAQPGFGAERVRQLSHEHQRQREETESMISVLQDTGAPLAIFAERLGHALANLRRAVADEERLLLDPDVLEGTGAASNVEAG